MISLQAGGHNLFMAHASARRPVSRPSRFGQVADSPHRRDDQLLNQIPIDPLSSLDVQLADEFGSNPEVRGCIAAKLSAL